MKKFLTLFLIIIITSTVAIQTTKAISLSEIFVSLSDKLYALRNLLTAQLTAECTNPIPPASQITEDMTTCSSSRDCKLVNIPLDGAGCMYCSFANNWQWMALNTRSGISIEPIRTRYCDCFPKTIGTEGCSSTPPPPTDQVAKCQDGRCIVEVTSGGSTSRYNCNTTTYQCASAANGTYASLEECQSACVASPTRYNCNTTTYQCATATNGAYVSLAECQTACKAPPAGKPTITDAQRKCTTDANCRIVETDCCGCSYGGDYKTKMSANYTSVSAFNSLLTKYCTENKLRPCKSIGTSNCRLTPTAKCVGGLCTANWPVVTPPALTDAMKKCTQDTDCSVVESACCGCDKGGNEITKLGIHKNYINTFNGLVKTYCYKSSQDVCSSTTNNCKTTPTATCINNVCLVKPTEKPTITDEMRKCTTVSDCSIVETDCCSCSAGGDDTSKKAISKNYLTYFDNLTQGFCGKTLCMMLYNCKEEPTLTCENNLCVAKFATSAPITYQWYKANVTLGNPQELWYQAVVSCAPQNSTKEKWEQCFKDYFAIQKIGIKQLIVGTVPTGSCTPTGCQAPAIQVQVSQEYKAQMLAIGFSEIDDPTKPVDPYILKIDLAKQGLLYGIDKTNDNIVYELVDKTAIVECGDGQCGLLEKYLYEIDLTQNCSINDQEVINYKHCYSDCKSKMDTGKSVTKAEFNLLKPQCSNKPAAPEPEKDETKSFMPMPKKPIDQMTQAEKTEYIKELQVFLIELLTQLLNMLKAQKGL